MNDKGPVLLKPDDDFPPPQTSDKQGLLAVGGDLSIDRLLRAYSQGIFPWYEPGCPLLWWSPDPRLILLPDEFKLSKSLKKTLNKPFEFKIDTAFKDVIHACASTGERLGKTWITTEMIEAYEALHELGYAHSFEVWLDETLVGGLYGVSLGRAFFGESMFHFIRDASKVAMYFLAAVMKEWRFDFIDCQLPTAHLISLGAEIIPRREFLIRLEKALKYPTLQKKWVYQAI